MYANIQKIKKSKFWKILCDLIAAVGVLANVIVLLAITATVLFRYVFKTSLFGTDEIIIMVAYWLYFIGGAYATATDGHIKADLISAFIHNQRFVYAARFVAKAVELVVTVAFCRWAFRYFLYTGIDLWPTTAGLHIPHIYMMMPIFIGYGLMAFLAFVQVCELGCLTFGDYKKYLGGKQDV